MMNRVIGIGAALMFGFAANTATAAQISCTITGADTNAKIMECGGMAFQLSPNMIGLKSSDLSVGMRVEINYQFRKGGTNTIRSIHAADE